MRRRRGIGCTPTTCICRRPSPSGRACRRRGCDRPQASHCLVPRGLQRPCRMGAGLSMLTRHPLQVQMLASLL